MPRSAGATVPTAGIAPDYALRPVEDADLAMLERWLTNDHVRRWWPDTARQLRSIRSHMSDPSVAPYVVTHKGRPIGYLQSYDVHAGDGEHPYGDQPLGTHGVDQFIGEAEMMGRGHGPRFVAYACGILFGQGAARVITDPHPENRRAVRAYEKAGFRTVDERATADGPVVLMARDRAE